MFSSFPLSQSTNPESISSRNLLEGILEPYEEKQFTLRMWLDFDTPVLDDVMEATFVSKITVTSTYQSELIIPYLDNVKGMKIPGKDDKYVLDRYECDPGVLFAWNPQTWNYTFKNKKNDSSQGVCKLFFKTIRYEVFFYSDRVSFEKNQVLTNLIQNGDFENDLDYWEW